MTLMVGDRQSESDLDSIRNSCDVFVRDYLIYVECDLTKHTLYFGCEETIAFFDSTLSLARQEDQTTDEQVQNEEYSNQLPHQKHRLPQRILEYREINSVSKQLSKK